jgi:hypothetical protein
MVTADVSTSKAGKEDQAKTGADAVAFLGADIWAAASPRSALSAEIAAP